jgi:hypothetical protein
MASLFQNAQCSTNSIAGIELACFHELLNCRAVGQHQKDLRYGFFANAHGAIVSQAAGEEDPLFRSGLILIRKSRAFKLLPLSSWTTALYRRRLPAFAPTSTRSEPRIKYIFCEGTPHGIRNDAASGTARATPRNQSRSGSIDEAENCVRSEELYCSSGFGSSLSIRKLTPTVLADRAPDQEGRFVTYRDSLSCGTRGKLRRRSRDVTAPGQFGPFRGWRG